jgi:dipeptidase E
VRSRLRIVAIGGGELKKLETLSIDRRIVALTGKRRPEALFLPTASGDPDKYIDTFRRVYGGKLGCKVGVLKLVERPPGHRETAERVLGADLVYVGGGNTYRMMRIWRRLGVDELLRKAAGRGVVLSGLSAGAICWFRSGHSDSRSFSGRADWDYIRVRGLGLVGATFCPHYHVEKREASLSHMIARRGGLVVACDNRAAIEIVGDGFRIIRSSRTAKAYRAFKWRGQVIVERLAAREEHEPLASLLDRRPGAVGGTRKRGAGAGR